MKALELSRRYYFDCCEPVLRREVPELLPRLAAGLVGEGSDCFGYDDELSRDHDWGLRVCLFFPDAELGGHGAALRAAEIEADVILKATMVDGVYDSDPKKNPNAKRYDRLTFMEVLNQNLGVMDMTAASFCKDRGIPWLVFSIEDPENIVRAVSGEAVGTLVK